MKEGETGMIFKKGQIDGAGGAGIIGHLFQYFWTSKKYSRAMSYVVFEGKGQRCMLD